MGFLSTIFQKFSRQATKQEAPKQETRSYFTGNDKWSTWSNPGLNKAPQPKKQESTWTPPLRQFTPAPQPYFQPSTPVHSQAEYYTPRTAQPQVQQAPAQQVVTPLKAPTPQQSALAEQMAQIGLPLPEEKNTPAEEKSSEDIPWSIKNFLTGSPLPPTKENFAEAETRRQAEEGAAKHPTTSVTPSPRREPQPKRDRTKNALVGLGPFPTAADAQAIKANPERDIRQSLAVEAKLGREIEGTQELTAEQFASLSTEQRNIVLNQTAIYDAMQEDLDTGKDENLRVALKERGYDEALMEGFKNNDLFFSMEDLQVASDAGALLRSMSNNDAASMPRVRYDQSEQYRKFVDSDNEGEEVPDFGADTRTQMLQAAQAQQTATLEAADKFYTSEYGGQVKSAIDWYVAELLNPSEELQAQGDFLEEDIVSLVEAAKIKRDDLADAALAEYIRLGREPANETTYYLQGYLANLFDAGDM